MKDHVGMDPDLTKFDAFMLNRDQGVDRWTWKIKTKVSTS